MVNESVQQLIGQRVLVPWPYTPQFMVECKVIGISDRGRPELLVEPASGKGSMWIRKWEGPGGGIGG